MIIPIRPSIVLILSDFAKLCEKKKNSTNCQGSDPRIQQDGKGGEKILIASLFLMVSRWDLFIIDIVSD